jgi:hypothetical protein
MVLAGLTKPRPGVRFAPKPEPEMAPRAEARWLVAKVLSVALTLAIVAVVFVI